MRPTAHAPVCDTGLLQLLGSSQLAETARDSDLLRSASTDADAATAARHFAPGSATAGKGAGGYRGSKPISPNNRRSARTRAPKIPAAAHLEDNGPAMASCCDDKSCALDELKVRQSGTLKIVLVINAVMFVVVAAGGYLASSTSLLTDSLDNLGDALTYGLSLYVVAGTARAKAKVALFKGGLILAAALAVVAQIIYRIVAPSTPIFEVMTGMAVLALLANGACLLLLWRHRQDDINMASVWECSRNDIASNVAVLVAAGTVAIVGSGWPDLIVATGLAVLLLVSAGRVIRRSVHELAGSAQSATPPGSRIITMHRKS